MRNYIFTSESVMGGHPDKICDRLSDTILDTYLQKDPGAHVAVETAVTTNRVILMGEVKSKVKLSNKTIESIVRKCIQDIGYEQQGFHWKDIEVQNYLHDQSSDIAQGVDAHVDQNGDHQEEGAGDQGIMFGFACRDTKAYMPAPIYYAHKILRTISNDIHDKKLAQLGPDGKCQISIQYKDGKPHKATSIVLSIQHSENLSQEQVRTLVRPYIEKALPDGWVCPDANIFINPTGRFVIGGPDGDAGLTGRKLTVDTYGGSIPHGGGSFSGKDPSKVDRSATYALRYLAKNIVAAGLADSCTLQLSYGIGISHPISLYINCHHTAKIPEQKILDLIPKLMDLSPRGIRDHLKLDRPIYERTATFGHFGPDPDADGGFSWERLDLVEKFKEILQ